MYKVFILSSVKKDITEIALIIYAILHTSRNPDLWRAGEENSDVDH